MFKLLKFFIKLALAALVLYYLALAGFDHLVEANTGTKVRIGGARLSLFPAEVELTRVRILNLKNFREPFLAVIPEIFVGVEPLDFLKGQIHIRNIRIHIQEITIEKNNFNEVNLNELRKILNQKQSTQQNPPSRPSSFTSTAEASSSRPQQNLTVDRAEFSLSRFVYADTAIHPPFRKEFVLNVEHQVLENVTDPLSLTQQIITAVFKAAGVKMASAQFDQFAANLGVQTGQLWEKAQKTLSDVFK